MASPPPRKDDASMYSWTQSDSTPVMQHKNPEPPKISDAVASINKDSFWSLPQKPCVRQSLMTGIGAGAAIIGVAMVARGRLRKAINTGVYSGVGITWASYEYCQYQKRQEAANMKRAVEVVREAREKKEAEAAQAQLQAQKAASATPPEPKPTRSWYRFW
ncbi:hypothetical protein NLU13_8581 [Sarocladium strictum]|uniref:Cytochrome c oxidase assembly protein COX20, mitochondrial n=1 Tax=Sarocladium strictum TaxID=5046 RepID=A0AA39GC00_SARSR|nr:hypothetical protein NLU13_8581 [Sarocladium strictum]